MMNFYAEQYVMRNREGMSSKTGWSFSQPAGTQSCCKINVGGDRTDLFDVCKTII